MEVSFVALVDFPVRKLIEAGLHPFSEYRFQSVPDYDEISLQEVIFNLPLELGVSQNLWIQEKLYRVNGALHDLFFHIAILLTNFTKSIRT